MQAHTTSTTNWHAVFSLNTKLGTGMIWLNYKVKRFPVIKMLISDTSSMGHMTRVKLHK